MTFNTLQEMIEYIENNTNKKVIPKSSIPDKNNIFWIFSEEGREVLNANGYFDRKKIRERMGNIFYSFNCKKCSYEKNICFICLKIKNTIKGL